MSSDNSSPDSNAPAATPGKDLLLVQLAVRQQPRRPNVLWRAVNRAAIWAEYDLAPWLRYELAPWLSRRGQEIRKALTRGWDSAEPWIKAVCIGLTATLLYPALALTVTLALEVADAITRSIAHLLGHLQHAGIAATVLDPIGRYITAHSAGLPVSATTVGWLWEFTGAGLWLTSALGSPISRLLWCGYGAGTAAMVCSASPDPGRPVATTITAAIWGAASLIALKGLNLRPFVYVDARTNGTSQETAERSHVVAPPQETDSSASPR